MTGPGEGPTGTGTAREFAYAVPAGLVIFLHAIVALVAVGGIITGISTLESGSSTSLYRLLIPLLGLITAVAAVALSVALWSRRGWWILLVPLCTVPCMVIAAFTYVAVSWSF
jgi:hypothetical protein